jgi:methionyl aminopeptidase
MVKIRSKREIDLMIVSNQIVAETLDLVSQFIEPGTPLKKLDSVAEDHIYSQGGRPAFKGYLGYPATLCISIDDAVVHGIPNGDILKEGQIVSIDCGVEKNGYYGDHARTFAVGEIDPDKQELMNTTRESLDIGIGLWKHEAIL